MPGVSIEILLKMVQSLWMMKRLRLEYSNKAQKLGEELLEKAREWGK